MEAKMVSCTDCVLRGDCQLPSEDLIGCRNGMSKKQTLIRLQFMLDRHLWMKERKKREQSV